MRHRAVPAPACVSPSPPEPQAAAHAASDTGRAAVTPARRRAAQAIAAASWFAVALTACTVGPDYVRPAAPVGDRYKEATPPPAGSGWKLAAPADIAPHGRWWTRYADPCLNALEERVAGANQQVAAAQARYQAARAAVAGVRSEYFPIVTGNAAYNRTRTSANLLFKSTAGKTVPDYLVGATASWEPDLWGRVSRGVEGARANAQASAADLQGAILSMQAELASDYIALRSVDAEQKLLADTIETYRRALELTRHRLDGGIATDADVAQADAQLTTTQAQAIDLGEQRAQLEHAIAVLLGEPPSAFALPSLPLDAPPVLVPVVTPTGVPSALLERRPDIAAAERRVAAANAQIGVATAAFFPDLILAVTGGLESTNFAPWLSAPSRFWSLGPQLAGTILDFGARAALRREAQAAYDESVANYRQTVLSAFGEVEDNLAALRVLENEARAQDQAVRAAERALSATTNRYTSGAVTYLDVVVTQAAVLGARRTALAIERRRMLASVALVKALGGGWQAAQSPAEASRPDR